MDDYEFNEVAAALRKKIDDGLALCTLSAAKKRKADRISELRDTPDTVSTCLTYKFRYTLTADEFVYDTIPALMDHILTLFGAIHYVAALEEKNGFMEPTHPHVHVHFTSELKLENMRSGFKSWRHGLKDFRKGTEMYAFKLEVDVIDSDRFFRYPLKQEHPNVDAIAAAPQGFDFGLQAYTAHDEWVREAEKKIAKRTKDALKTTVFGRMTVAIETEGVKFTTVSGIACWMFDYYAANGMAPCYQTISGYAALHARATNLITTQEWVEKKGCV